MKHDPRLVEMGFDQDEIKCCSSMRWVLPFLIRQEKIVYDTKRKAKYNDLLLCEVLEEPSEKEVGHVSSNMIERVRLKGGKHEFEMEPIQKGLNIIVAGDRYSSASFCGGLRNPLTGEPNGQICAGKTIVNLGRMNVGGFLNFNNGKEVPIRLRVLGVLAHKDVPVNLADFKPAFQVRQSKPCFTILIVGIDTNSGKTTCGTAIAQELTKRGHKVTFEKKTGGPCARDWIKPFLHQSEEYGYLGSKFSTKIASFPGRDFVDAAGCVTSHSVTNFRSFAQDSVEFSKIFVSSFRSEYNIIEIAGNLSEHPNLILLQRPDLRRKVGMMVFTAPPMYEIVHEFIHYATCVLGYDKKKIVLSGQIGNEDCPSLVSAEVKHRLKIPICKSGILSDGVIMPHGNELVEEIFLRQEKGRLN